ncbi:hypothetical protein PMIN03_007883 [Paraphaeosphaeria minitans]
MARSLATSRKGAIPATGSGSSSHPISIRDSNSPAPAVPVNPAPPAGRAGLRSERKLGKITAGQPVTKGNRAGKSAKKKEPKPQPLKKECIICITTRQVSNCAGRGFKAIDGACDHFQNTCNVCIGKMVKEKIIKRELDEAVLVCAFPDCEHVLDYNTIMNMIFKAARENWDNALLKHHFSTSDKYVACLQANCSRYFSIEDCDDNSSIFKSKTGGGRTVTCPYCEADMCLECMRPSHGTDSCDEAKLAEENQSLELIKDISKPCPKCGANIQKNGGCNHMKCRHCKHDFCFSCRIGFGPMMQHAEACPERHPNILQDPRNWLPDNVNPANWMAAMMGDPPELPQQAGQALPPAVRPPINRPPNPVGPPQQPGPNGLFGLLQLMRAFAQNPPEANGNANGGQGQA